MERGKVYLIGFMGAGKSTVAPHLAEELGLDWVDTDGLIEEKTDLSIPEIFEYYGEGRFRELERETIREISEGDPKVVAVGGGAPMDDENWERMKSTGEVVYLEVSPKEVMERVGYDGSRPLLADLNLEEKEEKIRRLMKKRHPRYNRADFALLCNGAGTVTVAEEIASKLNGKYEDS